MTSKRLNGFVAGLVDVVVKANGYNPLPATKGGDRELAQAEIGKVLIKQRRQILLATGLTEEQIDAATAECQADYEAEAVIEDAAKAATKASKEAA